MDGGMEEGATWAGTAWGAMAGGPVPSELPRPRTGATGLGLGDLCGARPSPPLSPPPASPHLPSFALHPLCVKLPPPPSQADPARHVRPPTCAHAHGFRTRKHAPTPSTQTYSRPLARPTPRPPPTQPTHPASTILHVAGKAARIKTDTRWHQSCGAWQLAPDARPTPLPHLRLPLLHERAGHPPRV